MNKDKLATIAGDIAQTISYMNEFPQDKIFMSDDSEFNSMHPDYLYLRNQLTIKIFEALETVYNLGHDDGFNEGVCK